MIVSIPTTEALRGLAMRVQELQGHPLVQVYLAAYQLELAEFKKQLSEAGLTLEWSGGIFPKAVIDDRRNGRWNRYILSHSKHEKEAIQTSLALLYLCVGELSE